MRENLNAIMVTTSVAVRLMEFGLLSWIREHRLIGSAMLTAENHI